MIQPSKVCHFLHSLPTPKVVLKSWKLLKYTWLVKFCQKDLLYFNSILNKKLFLANPPPLPQSINVGQSLPYRLFTKVNWGLEGTSDIYGNSKTRCGIHFKNRFVGLEQKLVCLQSQQQQLSVSRNQVVSTADHWCLISWRP